MLSQVAPLTQERLERVLSALADEVFVSSRGAMLAAMERVLVRVENPEDRAFALHMTTRWPRSLPASQQARLRETIEELNREVRISRLALQVDDGGVLVVWARLTHWVAPGANDAQLEGWLRRGAADLRDRLTALDRAFPELEGEGR